MRFDQWINTPQNVAIRIVCLRVLFMHGNALAEETLTGLFQKLREPCPAGPCEGVGAGWKLCEVLLLTTGRSAGTFWHESSIQQTLITNLPMELTCKGEKYT